MELPLVLPLLVLPLLWIAMGQLFGLAYPVVGRLVSQLPPHPRSLFQLVYSMLPLIISGTIAIMVFTPLVGGVNLSGHCHGLDCAAHVPVLQASPFSAGILTWTLLAISIITLLVLAVSIWRNHRVTGMLCSLSRKGMDSSFNILETPELLACCVGVIKPQVLISRGLVQLANPVQLQVILNHELAHACRIDNLRRLLVSLATLVWPRMPRYSLLIDIDLAHEQSCDEHVSVLLGSRLVVADTIRSVVSWHAANAQCGDRTDMDFCDARIALLTTQDVHDMTGWKPAMMVITGSAVFMLMAADVLHRAAEAVLTVVPVIY